MRPAIKLSQDGVVTEVDLGAFPGSLDVLQAAVGGYVEVVRFSKTVVLWVNEDGRFHPAFKPNRIASRMCGREVVGGIVGPVIFTGAEDRHGNTTGLTTESKAALLANIESHRRG